MTKTSIRSNPFLLALGIAATVYGITSLMFELLVQDSSAFANALLRFFNPVFVAFTSGVMPSLSTLSFFLAVCFLGWPVLFVVLGIILMFSE